MFIIYKQTVYNPPNLYNNDYSPLAYNVQNEYVIMIIILLINSKTVIYSCINAFISTI